MKHGAIELSANFIVVLVLSAALMVSGFILIKNVFSKTMEMKETLDKKTESDIEDMLSSGSKVAIPFSTKEAKKGKLVTFGIGILNILPGSSTSDQFNVEIKFNATYGMAKNDITADVLPKNPDSWLMYSKDIQEINKNQDHNMAVGIKTRKDIPSGDYIFNVNVSYKDGNEWKPYDDLRKIIVKV